MGQKQKQKRGVSKQNKGNRKRPAAAAADVFLSSLAAQRSPRERKRERETMRDVAAARPGV